MYYSDSSNLKTPPTFYRNKMATELRRKKRLIRIFIFASKINFVNKESLIDTRNGDNKPAKMTVSYVEKLSLGRSKYILCMVIIPIINMVVTRDCYFSTSAVILYAYPAILCR